MDRVAPKGKGFKNVLRVTKIIPGIYCKCQWARV